MVSAFFCPCVDPTHSSTAEQKNIIPFIVLVSFIIATASPYPFGWLHYAVTAMLAVPYSCPVKTLFADW